MQFLNNELFEKLYYHEGDFHFCLTFAQKESFWMLCDFLRKEFIVGQGVILHVLECGCFHHFINRCIWQILSHKLTDFHNDGSEVLIKDLCISSVGHIYPNRSTIRKKEKKNFFYGTSHLDHFFISQDQDVVFVFICDPSFNMIKPTATNHYKPDTTLVFFKLCSGFNTFFLYHIKLTYTEKNWCIYIS